MNEVRVEQLGGFAGFGGPHLKSSGVVDLSRLSPADRAAVESLFQRYRASSAAPAYPAQFRYRLTRQTPAGTETVEAPEHEVPDVVKASVSAHLE
jgi:Emfourin